MTLAVVAASPAFSEGPLRKAMRERMAARMKSDPAPGATEYAYGVDPQQKLDLWKPKGATKPTPLVLFVHGGGWKRGDKNDATGADMVGHLTGQGYAVASINYRLVPAASVEKQAQDVAAAIAWARDNAAKIGVDPGRIVIMGHSAGAHLVALVGTDERWLEALGLTEGAVRGVIALDGAAYDVPSQLDQAGPMMRNTYEQAFGTDIARQRALSPTAHAAGPNAPAFLILHIDRADGKAQSDALGAALAKSGTPAEVKAIDGKGLRGHMEINRELGQASYPATAIVDNWLKGIFAAP
ncbi:alpha/beta hydrolase [Sphingomonas crocodyli]|uniref:Alpha/beta hydrolase n=2 Tax=Sphingomonas crocodyli TaxID=1979270 RepID=A0A437MC02_9SPHN|nr:alpha/beta hydrolase [Sphingomonas crocodyli]